MTPDATIRMKAVSHTTKGPVFRTLCKNVWLKMSAEKRRNYKHTFAAFLQAEQMKATLATAAPSWRPTSEPGKFVLRKEPR